MAELEQSKLLKAALWIGCSILTLSGCGGGGSDSSPSAAPSPSRVEVYGSIQKGPFIVGSTVTINLLSDSGTNTGTTIVTQTDDDLGSFTFTTESQILAQISATGFYRNEINGQLSSAQLTLRSIDEITADVDQRSNVNVLTHITSNRARNIMQSSGVSFENALDQAESEFLLEFADVIPNSLESKFTSLSIYNDSDAFASAYLLSVSSVIYQYGILAAEMNASTADAEFALALNELEADFAADGAIDGSLEDLRAAIPLLNPDQITDNVNSWISEDQDLSAADINEFLDTDLDGVFNSTDPDDDNDGVNDADDPAPYAPGFVTQNVMVVTNEDSNAVIDVLSNSPASGPIELTVGRLPQNGELSGDYPQLTYSPDANFAGTDDFAFTLSQGAIVSDEITVDITISSVADAPVISGNPTTEIVARNAYSFTPTILNLEDAELTFAATNVPTWAFFDEFTGTLSGTPDNENAGDYANIQVSVSDGTLSASLDPFAISVRSNPWDELASMPTRRHSPAAVAKGSSFFVIGGFASNHLQLVEIYDLDSGTWSTGTPLQIGRSGHTAHAINDELFVVGGLSGNEIASVESFSVSGNTWSQRSPLTIPRSSHASCVFEDNIYVFGGFTVDGDPNTTNTLSVATVEMYNPANDTWTARAPMQSENWGMTCVVFGSQIYLFGGAGNEDGYWIYNPGSDTWESGGQLSVTRRYGFAGASSDGKIYLLGGYSAGPTDRTDVLDLDTAAWSQQSPVPTPRYNPGFIAYEGRIYLFGGRNNGSNGLSDASVYEPALDSD